MPRLGRTIAGLRVRGNDLDGENHVLRFATGLVRSCDGLGPYHADIRLGTVARVEDDGHLPTDPECGGQPGTQTADQEADHAGVEAALRTHEDQAPVDQLGVRREIRQGEQVVHGVAVLWRHRPLNAVLDGVGGRGSSHGRDPAAYLSLWPSITDLVTTKSGEALAFRHLPRRP
jgi:hypothetical protein